jgi:hypothetical protein
MDNDVTPLEPLDSADDCGGTSGFWINARDPAIAKILAIGYASVMVVLAAGFVLLCIVMAVLSFFHPDKAGEFLTVFGIPAATLFGAYIVKAKNNAKAYIKKKD